MRQVLIAGVLAVWVLGLLGNLACGGSLPPVYVPTSPALPPAGGPPFTAQHVEEATVQGAVMRGWKIVHRAPGLVIADIVAGGHGARVRILSDATGWRIEHEQSSPGLRWSTDPSYGQVIHKRYNQWVKALDDSIRRALYSPAISAGGYYPPPQPVPGQPDPAQPAPVDPNAPPPPAAPPPAAPPPAQ
jgi:hypothetical protein